MQNVIVIIILVVIIGAAIRYIYVNKKKGVKCIGCPCAGSCSKSCCNVSMNNANDK